MAITGIELLEDRLRIHDDLPQPAGVANHDNTIEILYANIPNMRVLPEGKYGEEISIPKCNQTIVLVTESMREPETMCGCRSYWYEIYRK
jgi:hypothetical protein